MRHAPRGRRGRINIGLAVALVALVLVAGLILWWNGRAIRQEVARTTGTGPGAPTAQDTLRQHGTPVSPDPLQPFLPDPAKTPGATLPVTAADICVPGYARKVRNVPSSVKKKVYLSYGITNRRPRQYEVDHLISLQLGGSNSIRNLWPESYLTEPWNAYVKDALENELHRRVCKEGLDLATAQREIATDWIAAYRKYFRTDRPLPRHDAIGEGRAGSGREDEAEGLRRAR
ncbi:MAG TPA: hypothetical protein VFS40_08285 [Gemmatimonadales bacterium]|nr:hypothetical protein [Gemmatimonadales bacterium]